MSEDKRKFTKQVQPGKVGGKSEIPKEKAVQQKQQMILKVSPKDLKEVSSVKRVPKKSFDRRRVGLLPTDGSPFKQSNSQVRTGLAAPNVPVKGKEPSRFHEASMVKPAKTSLSSDMIQQRLKKKSPWYDSLMSPITGGGVKIPDPIGTNTGTYQHVQNVSVPVNVGGVAGLRIISPLINSYVKTDAGGSNYQITGPDAVLAGCKWGSGAAPGNTLAFTAIPSLMKSNAISHRVVSACVTAQAEISSLNDAGEMCAFVTPYRCRDYNIPYNTYTAAWDSAILPINAKRPLIARWYPLSSDFDHFNGVSTNEEEEQTISYQDFIDPNVGENPDEQGVIPWELGIVCTGMTPETGVVRFQIVVNYEFIPLTSTAMVTQAPSPIDPMEEQLVNGWVASVPMTGIVSQKQAAQGPSDTKVPEEETGFGMFADVVKQLVPFALSML